MLLAQDAHFGIHQMLRYIPKTWPNGIKPACHLPAMLRNARQAGRSRSGEAGRQFGDLNA